MTSPEVLPLPAAPVREGRRDSNSNPGLVAVAAKLTLPPEGGLGAAAAAPGGPAADGKLHPFQAAEVNLEEEEEFSSSDNSSVDFVQEPGSRVRKFSEDSSAKEIDRVEWTRHLQRRVSQQLDRTDRFLGQQAQVATPLGSLVQGNVFQGICAGVIILNAVFVGYTSDVSMTNVLKTPPEAEPAWFKLCNTTFTAIYVVEVALRIYALRLTFFFGPDWKWNALDTFLVVTSVAEDIFQDVGLGSLRIIRGLRMFRVLRIIRVMRFFRDLRLMIGSVMQSLASLSWALLLLLIIMYLFAVFFMQGTIMYFRSEEEPSAFVREGITSWYGSVFDTMYTLLATITGGLNWFDVVQPLEEISMLYRCLFCFYVVFVVIGVLNVLTGIFVERAQELSGLDRDLVIQTELKRNETFLVEMRRIFEEADADGSGTISWGEFKGYLENDRVKAYLATQQLDAFDARTLFDILNVGEGEEISIDKFIVGCMRLKGMAKSVDLLAVLNETREVSRRLKVLARELEEKELVPAGAQNLLRSFSRRNSGSVTSSIPECHAPAAFSRGASRRGSRRDSGLLPAPLAQGLAAAAQP